MPLDERPESVAEQTQTPDAMPVPSTTGNGAASGSGTAAGNGTAAANGTAAVWWDPLPAPENVTQYRVTASDGRSIVTSSARLSRHSGR